MNKTAASLLGASLIAIVSGVAWIYPPAGAIVGGVILGALGVLTMDARSTE